MVDREQRRDGSPEGGRGAEPAQGTSTGRRTVLRLIAGTGAAAAMARAVAGVKSEGRAGGRRIEVTGACCGCTGCIAICPTGAIDAVAGGISVDEELCIGCGYCQAGCPVGGIRVGRSDADG